MRILAFDTATPATTVALADLTGPGESTVAWSVERRDDPAPGARPNHTSRLLELVEEALAEAGLDWPEVDRIAVGVGPGTFTGLRIGIATAQALARARDIGLAGVSTLEALALPALRADPSRGVLAVLDARRGEAFAAAWAAGWEPDAGPPRLAPSVLSPERLERVASDLGHGDLTAVGDGAIKFADSLKRFGLQIPPEDSALHRITALAHCRLAARVTTGEPDAIQPEYLRLPDAELARRK